MIKRRSKLMSGRVVTTTRITTTFDPILQRRKPQVAEIGLDPATGAFVARVSTEHQIHEITVLPVLGARPGDVHEETPLIDVYEDAGPAFGGEYRLRVTLREMVHAILEAKGLLHK